jgi:hypothetical protein
MSDFKKRLKKFEKGWKQAKGTQDRTFTKPPDGKHKFVLVSAQVGESKSSQRLQVTWDFRITKGKAINQHAYQYDSLEDERGWAMIKGRLKAMKVSPPSRLSDLSAALDKACDRKVLATLKSRGDFQDMVIIKRLKKKKASSDEETEGLD